MCDVADRLENKGRKQMMFSLVQDGTLEISVAAQKIQMTVPEFEKAMTAAGYKIPDEVQYSYPPGVGWEDFLCFEIRRKQVRLGEIMSLPQVFLSTQETRKSPGNPCTKAGGGIQDSCQGPGLPDT